MKIVQEGENTTNVISIEELRAEQTKRMQQQRERQESLLSAQNAEDPDVDAQDAIFPDSEELEKQAPNSMQSQYDAVSQSPVIEPSELDSEASLAADDALSGFEIPAPASNAFSELELEMFDDLDGEPWGTEGALAAEGQAGEEDSEYEYVSIGEATAPAAKKLKGFIGEYYIFFVCLVLAGLGFLIINVGTQLPAVFIILAFAAIAALLIFAIYSAWKTKKKAELAYERGKAIYEAVHQHMVDNIDEKE